MFKSLRSAACLAVLACSTALASAATVTSTTYDFYGLGWDGAKYAGIGGEFVTNASNDITSISGVFGNSGGLFGNISGLVPTNFEQGVNFNFDNKYNPTTGFDDAGVLFLVNGQQVNLYGESDGAHVYTYYNGFGDLVLNLDLTVHQIGQTFATEVSAVPENGIVYLMLAGSLILGGMSLRQQRKAIRA